MLKFCNGSFAVLWLYKSFILEEWRVEIGTTQSFKKIEWVSESSILDLNILT